MTVKRCFQPVLDFLVEEDGPAAVEYAVMIGLILAVVIGSVLLLGQVVDVSLESSHDAIQGASSS